MLAGAQRFLKFGPSMGITPQETAALMEVDEDMSRDWDDRVRQRHQLPTTSWINPGMKVRVVGLKMGDFDAIAIRRRMGAWEVERTDGTHCNVSANLIRIAE